MTETFPTGMGSTGGTCGSAESALRLLGRAWAGAVVEAMLGGAERFSDIRRAIPGITDAVLTARLRELCERDFAVRDVEAGPPTVVTYRLTDAGRDIGPVLEALTVFAGRHATLLAR
ncbi:helix-turn-helix domain-containing protein [Nocardioides sp. R-C-SC26]|uniref:winged helix-turn-helix transcriptional regulator n=1 Tax=Nocardioides sp. R-C-SC26 TaxID=2870414 RepID=UPI001E65CF86|nr:helix-turn-helix domain-containing protein [Nocardioides sp. R-C-SC26]